MAVALVATAAAATVAVTATATAATTLIVLYGFFATTGLRVCNFHVHVSMENWGKPIPEKALLTEGKKGKCVPKFNVYEYTRHVYNIYYNGPRKSSRWILRCGVARLKYEICDRSEFVWNHLTFPCTFQILFAAHSTTRNYSYTRILALDAMSWTNLVCWKFSIHLVTLRILNVSSVYVRNINMIHTYIIHWMCAWIWKFHRQQSERYF